MTPDCVWEAFTSSGPPLSSGSKRPVPCLLNLAGLTGIKQQIEKPNHVLFEAPATFAAPPPRLPRHCARIHVQMQAEP